MMINRSICKFCLVGGIALLWLLSGCSTLPTNVAQGVGEISATHTTFLPEVMTVTLTPSPEVTAVSQPTATPESFPDPTTYHWNLVSDGLDKPVGAVNAADGSGRLFIVEQVGVIRILINGQLSSQPFLDIRDRVGTDGSERGLLGLTFHPDYIHNGYFYVDYTDRGGNTQISRFRVSQNPDLADPASEKSILQVSQPYPNHNGGQLAFGSEGYLYIGMGDGGSAGDPQGNGQSLQTLLGKILRIDVDHGDPYAIPAENPFANGGGRPEIWAYGLRNPWRFSFDNQTGDLYIGDVGQSKYEEIDFLPAGSKGGTNFGWNYREGNHPYAGDPPPGLILVDPVVEYDHQQGCSVTGGFVYRGSQLPAWQGTYLYGDYCSGRIWGLFRSIDGTWQSKLLFETTFSITSFGEDEQGELYLLNQKGAIYRLGL